MPAANSMPPRPHNPFGPYHNYTGDGDNNEPAANKSAK